MASYRPIGGGRVSLLDAVLQCVIISKLGYELRESLQVPRELPRELHVLVTKITERDEWKDR